MRSWLASLVWLVPAAVAAQPAPPVTAPVRGDVGLANAVPFRAQERIDTPTITVDASASVEREPERAVLTLAVESGGATAQLASQANATAMDRVLRSIRGLGIADRWIRTVSFQLGPVYSRVRAAADTPRIVGYTAVNMVQVTVDTMGRVGAVIDAAIGAGANRVAGLSFELRDWDAARIAALELAVAKAKREAEAVARAAGQRLGTPISISMSATPVPRPMFEARAVDMAAAVATPVEGGTLSVTASVHIVYRLERQ
jgi:hypothetical protein